MVGRVSRVAVHIAAEAQRVATLGDGLGMVALVAQVLPILVGVLAAPEQRYAVVDLGCALDDADLEAMNAERLTAQQSCSGALQAAAAYALDHGQCHAPVEMAARTNAFIATRS